MVAIARESVAMFRYSEAINTDKFDATFVNYLL